MIVVNPCRDFGVKISTTHMHAKILKLLKSLAKILCIAQSAHNTWRYAANTITAKMRLIKVIARGFDVILID